jgi:hypothetical protein
MVPASVLAWNRHDVVEERVILLASHNHGVVEGLARELEDGRPGVVVGRETQHDGRMTALEELVRALLSGSQHAVVVPETALSIHIHVCLAQAKVLGQYHPGHPSRRSRLSSPWNAA